MDLRWQEIRNPFLDTEPQCSRRDPALLWEGGLLRCFHSAVEFTEDLYRFYLDVTESADLVHWTAPRRLTTSTLNFSSPGNVIRVGARWVMCVQSYPIERGQEHGSPDCRLWVMESDDLSVWSEPRMLSPDAREAPWTPSRRRIDPYIVQHDGRFWCFYKTGGNLAVMVSRDLYEWQDGGLGRPVLTRQDTPDGAGLENPCVIHDGTQFVMFFAPCRPGRGVGVARSDDLLHWRDTRYLDFPPLPWAPGGPSAAMVLDLRGERGKWLMAFHGECGDPHNAVLGLAWSADLEHWECP